MPRSRSSAAVVALTAAALLAGPIRAEPAAVPDAPARLNLSRLASRFDAGQALKLAGIARTSVDRSLDPHATASLGFLCGAAPQSETRGPAGALGADHDGRFLGAQLRLGFR